jgi:hypothetical protein
MTALANKDRTVLELISQKGAMTRSEIRDLISRKGSKDFQVKSMTAMPQPEAENVIDAQINELINQSLLSGKPAGSSPGDEVISLSEQGVQALSLLISFFNLRRAIGIVGMALPVVLLLGNLFFGDHGIQSSISAYYYTGMRNVFVGAICAIAVFLLSYRGYERDYRWTYVAGFFAILVALFPTTPGIPNPTSQERIIGSFHLIFAAIFFSALAGICFWLFTKTDVPKEELNNVSHKGKRIRNRVYRACGWVIVACILLIVIVNTILSNTPVMQIKPVFILEFVALLAFGFSWIIKSNWNIKLLKFLHDGA